MSKKVYINIESIKNDPAVVKYISSDRSDGKSTLWVTLPYEEFKKSGKIGVLARRTVGEVTENNVKVAFKNLKVMYPNAGKLTLSGSAKRSGIGMFEDGKQFAVFVPLSRATAVKSAFDVKTHKNLYIDEYVPLNGRYLYNEVASIWEIYRTIDRDTDTNDIWVFTNHTTATNPLFRYYDITPKDGLTRYKNGDFILLQVANKGNREGVKQSRMGRLNAGTPYGDYAAGGTLDAAKRFIQPEHYKSRYQFVLRGKNGTFGLFFASNGVVLDYTKPTTAEIIYSTEPTNGKDGGVYLKSQLARSVYIALKTRYHLSQMLFATEQVYEDSKDIQKILE